MQPIRKKILANSDQKSPILAIKKPIAEIKNTIHPKKLILFLFIIFKIIQLIFKINKHN